MSGTEDDKRKAAKAHFKNRFYHFPEGETLIEADWRIAHKRASRSATQAARTPSRC